MSICKGPNVLGSNLDPYYLAQAQAYILSLLISSPFLKTNWAGLPPLFLFGPNCWEDTDR